MAKGWHPANGKTGRSSSRISIGAFDLFSTDSAECGQLFLVQLIGAADQSHRRLAIDHEQERFDNLSHVTANGLGGLLGCPGAGFKFFNFNLQTERLSRIGNFLSGWVHGHNP